MAANTSPPSSMRRWQQRALDQFLSSTGVDFFVEATPGAGKTRFAIAALKEILKSRRAEQIVVVAPTDHLRSQWVEAAKSQDLILTPVGETKKNAVGVVTTYAQVATKPHIFEAFTMKRPTIVVLDECHHCGDGASWGDAARVAFTNAKKRLLLSGTPFRTDPTSPIPFVSYEPANDSSAPVSKPDFRYGYGDALGDGGVVRVVRFAAITGTATWDEDGEIQELDMDGSSPEEVTGESPLDDFNALLREGEVTAQEMKAWRTILAPEGDWVTATFQAANESLMKVRETFSDAGGLILAGDQQHAKAYAQIMSGICGKKVPVAVSEDPNASKIIDKFANSEAPWLVAVRLVSEGTDIPRLMNLVFATPVRTEMFFRQAVGRVVRTRNSAETALVFIPAVKPLLRLADTIEEERDHVLRYYISPADEIPGNTTTDEEEQNHEKDCLELETQERTRQWQPLNSSAGHTILLTPTPSVHAALTDDEQTLMGIPGLLRSEDQAEILRRKATEEAKREKKERRDYLANAPRDKWETAGSIRLDISRALPAASRILRMQPEDVVAAMSEAHPGADMADASAELLAYRRQWLKRRVPSVFHQ